MPTSALRLVCCFAFFVVSSTSVDRVAAEESPLELLKNSKRIVFLGDSITASGRYVAFFNAWLSTRKLDPSPLVIDAGLSSETVSGLSEDGHAGGKFPRPDLHERLDRVLALTKPDLVFACYGINCGIYQPFDESRLAKYQEGYRTLKSKLDAIGAKLVVITPPFYDDRQKNPGEFSYNGVLDRYTEWLLGQRSAGWRVVDLHTAMTQEVARRRESDPKFTFQPDRVHPNDAGHWFMAQQLIAWFGDAKSAAAETPQAMLALNGVSPAALNLEQQRVNVLRDAYVATAGHKRPGVGKGLPIPEAEAKFAELTRELQALPPATK
jgi:lysophospholipase L1-like esterase